MTPIPLLVHGLGRIGRGVVSRLEQERASISSALGRPMRVAVVSDSTGFVHDPDLPAVLAHKASGGALADLGGSALHWPEQPGILLDASSADTASLWRTALDRGWGIVSANKIPLAGAFAGWDTWSTAWLDGRLGVAGTVGAGVPSEALLHTLRRGGDRGVRVEGIVSGTLAAVLADLGQGAGLSQAVARARREGFTEPDPVADLSGEDVGRKLLILGRLAGLWTEDVPVTTEPLVNVSWKGLPAEELDKKIQKLDRVWQARAQAARRSGRTLRYVGVASADGVRCGLQALPASEPLGRLSPDENGVSFTTQRYPTTPTTISGPGRGTGVTEATLVADLLRVARTLG